jgi:hypothetical protein
MIINWLTTDTFGYVASIELTDIINMISKFYVGVTSG